MNSLLVLIHYKLLESLRRIKDNLFTLGVLGPLIFIIAYLIAVPYLRALALGVYAPPAPALAGLLVSAIILLLLLAPASAVANEFYPLQSPDAYLDSLPIGVAARFCELALARVLKNLPLAMLL